MFVVRICGQGTGAEELQPHFRPELPTGMRSKPHINGRNDPITIFVRSQLGKPMRCNAMSSNDSPFCHRQGISYAAAALLSAGGHPLNLFYTSVFCLSELERPAKA